MTNKNHTGRPVLAACAAAALLLLVFTLAAFRPNADLRAQMVAPAQDAPPAAAVDSRGTGARPAPPAGLHDSTSAQELGRAIDRAIDEGEFASARWGIFVLSLRDGRVLYARNADRAFAPASNLKLYTTAAALDLLGADYRWRTSVYATAAPDKEGTIAGDLTLYGRGAPDLYSVAEKGEGESQLDRLAGMLYERGVRRVRGSLVGDESYLRGDPLGNGWLWNDVQWYFGAEVSALSVNDNEVDVNVTPSGKAGEAAGVRLKPETSYVQIENDARTVERGTPATIGVTRGLSDNVVRVWGDFPAGGASVNARLSVHRPALWAALLFRDALKRRGITVEGETRAVDARENGQGVDAGRALELAYVTSKTLGEVARLTNKESINLYAELILRTLGKERGATAPAKDPKKMLTRGDDGAGTAVVRLWLEQHGIHNEPLELHDGSGLSRLDLVTPEATARLLAAVNQSRAAGVFLDSLPVSGRDGTLKSRLRGAGVGRVRAKTGTLTYVNSLSGYATSRDDEPLAFSIICNDETAEHSSTPVVDAIASLLATYKESGK